MKKLMMGTATINLAGYTKKGINEFKRAVHPETIIDAKLHILTCKGEEIEMDVMEFLAIQLKAYDAEYCYEIEDADELNC